MQFSVQQLSFVEVLLQLRPHRFRLSQTFCQRCDLCFELCILLLLVIQSVNSE